VIFAKIPFILTKVSTMQNLLIYFFRQNQLLYNFGMLSFALLYTYILSYWFFDGKIINYLMIGSISSFLFWLILFLIFFLKDRNNLFLAQEREIFNQFVQQIKNEFGVRGNSDVFSKIDLIKNFIDKNFSSRGLFANKIYTLTNNSLNLYIENLNIIKELREAKHLVQSYSKEDQFYKEEIAKNLEQNEIIVQKLDSFIKEMMSKKNNDKKVDRIAQDFEHSMEIFNTINSRR